MKKQLLLLVLLMNFSNGVFGSAANAALGLAKQSFKHDPRKSAFSTPSAASSLTTASKAPAVKKQSGKHSSHVSIAAQATATNTHKLEEQFALHEEYKKECEELIKNGSKEQLSEIIEMRGKYAALIKKLQELKCPRTSLNTIFKDYLIKISNKAKSFN